MQPPFPTGLASGPEGVNSGATSQGPFMQNRSGILAGIVVLSIIPGSCAEVVATATAHPRAHA